jgi:hypothetical protein
MKASRVILRPALLILSLACSAHAHAAPKLLFAPRGEAAGDGFGVYIGGADFNGDGYPHVIVGALFSRRSIGAR